MKLCHLFSSVGCQCHLYKGAVRIQTHARALRMRWRELASDEFDRLDEQSIPKVGTHYPSSDNSFLALPPLP